MCTSAAAALVRHASSPSNCPTYAPHRHPPVISRPHPLPLPLLTPLQPIHNRCTRCRQKFPVVRRGRRTEVADADVMSSPLWDNVRILTLTVDIRVLCTRAESDRLRDVCAWQIRVGNETEEKVPATDDSRHLLRIPSAHCVPFGDAGKLVSRIGTLPLSLPNFGQRSYPCTQERHC